MSVFLLPSTLQDELEKMMNSFWWGSNNNPSKGIPGSTRKLSTKKEFGGIGCRHLHVFNLVMLGK